MKTDLYTKTVLTVIAVALVCLVFKHNNPITSMYASDTPDAPFLTPGIEKTASDNVFLSGHSVSRFSPLPVYIVEATPVEEYNIETEEESRKKYEDMLKSMGIELPLKK